MLLRGIQFLDLSQLVTHPLPSLNQQKSGGFLDPILGTLILTMIGTLIAAPVGVAIAVWLSEYGRPAGLARAVESGVEIVAGTPTIVLAIFGLIVFQNGAFSFLSFTAAGGAVFGKSFLTAGAIMSLIAVPLVVGAHPRGAAGDPTARARGLLRARQGQGLDHPAGAAAGLAAGHRHRGRPRHGPDRRRHGDRGDPARRLPDAAGRRAGHRSSAP